MVHVSMSYAYTLRILRTHNATIHLINHLVTGINR